MSYDVNDPEKGFQSDVERNSSRSLLGRQQSQNILSRIRNFNISSIGSAFSGPLSAITSYVTQEGAKTNYSYDTWNYGNDLESGRAYEGSESRQGSCYSTHHTVGSSTPTQTRSNYLLKTNTKRLSGTKYLFNNLARLRFTHPDQIPITNSSSSSSDWNSTSHTRRDPLYAPSVYEWDETSGTPPLTPDSFEDISLPSPVVPGDYDDNLKYQYDDEESAIEWSRSSLYSSDIKEGKKPDRVRQAPSFFSSWLTFAIKSSDALNDNTENYCSEKSEPSPPVVVYDDRDEWYGLEYTLELSCRERLPSDTTSAGEHSKSRESWAAIHRGTIHPFLEDEDYYKWKNWHRYLDRQDERKKHRRGLEFKACSKDLACLYVDEMHIRDLLYWQKEVYGVVAKEVKERLNVLAQHRPDPYSPRKKHNLGWYLKRSLSVACLRELCPLPSPKQPVRSRECNDSPNEEICIDDYILLA
ncbi:hypothetical protein C0989_012213 [Termitomyces sp. Mn162]|nr:hypothetical protein C0989_012213 [Termitomyces sp. Mn162]